MIRYDDADKSVSLSVLDLVDAGGPSGHLVLEVVERRQSRLQQGREVHVAWQDERAAADETFRAEVRLKHQLAVRGWTVTVHGRVDGLVEEVGRTVVEEVKSTALDVDRLSRTSREDWPKYASQLEIYLWMVAEARRPSPEGRLVLVSLADGSQHVLGVALDHARVDAFVRRQAEQLVVERERRLAWLRSRRASVVPQPFPDWREGQDEIARVVEASLDRGDRVLVEAPTGLGKTGAVMYAVLRHALRTDRQVFWATARTTQQLGVEKTLRRFADAGLSLRTLTLGARERACINGVVACRPDSCRFADRFWDKLAEHDLVEKVAADGGGDLETMRTVGRRFEVCPHALTMDVAGRVDVVIGDYNYAFDPGVSLARFGEEAERWIVVVDEAHQLVDRARGYRSPRVEAALARRAVAALQEPVFAPWRDLAEHVLDAVLDARLQAEEPIVGGDAPMSPSLRTWRDLADRVDELGLDYALLRAERPVDDDPWQDLARAVLRYADALATMGEETVATCRLVEGEEAVQLVCLDPSTFLGPKLAALGGAVACSATLSPSSFYRDLLGLDPNRLETVRVPSPFPPERRKVVVAPRVSTAFKDRAKHAEPTARLVEEVALAVPGNVAVYFPSFAMLDDISRRWTLPGREIRLQTPSMSEERRREGLERLAAGGRPVVLAAVLGGIFAEGIDLPPGALDAVVVVGPALPPVGLERDLLRQWYDDRYGEGFRYASLVPGMTRVVQAAGRLVRRPEDRGVVVLVDRRFRHRDYRELLPEDWVIEVPDDVVGAVASFWTEGPPPASDPSSG